MTHVTYRLTTKNRDQLRNPTFGNRVLATFTFFTSDYLRYLRKKIICNPLSHPTWKCTTLTCEVPNFFLSDWRFALYLRFPSLQIRTCVFRTCVFHPCEMRCFVLAFTVLAFSSTCVFSAPKKSSVLFRDCTRPSVVSTRPTGHKNPFPRPCLEPKISAKFDRGQPPRGRQLQVGGLKLATFGK